MNPPRIMREVQHLTGRLAALSRFITRLGERSLLFFKALKNTPNFQWTLECQKSFEELKVYLSSLNVLFRPKEGETLFLYLRVTDRAVSVVLVREEE
jgi:hypothetical protein